MVDTLADTINEIEHNILSITFGGNVIDLAGNVSGSGDFVSIGGRSRRSRRKRRHERQRVQISAICWGDGLPMIISG
jgi:predicted alpha/beta hydrolase